MCIALPRKVVAVDNEDENTVIVSDTQGSSRVISAVLLLLEGQKVASLVGRYVISQSGFAIESMDEAEALSRLNAFDAAMAGDGGLLDIPPEEGE